jgi:hypothetical protein
VTSEFIAFLETASLRRAGSGRVRRFNQGRAAGCVTAEFTVLDDLPPEHRVGLFAEPRTYSAAIRFANASSATDRDKDVRGMSIAVAQVPGENLTAGKTTQDFVLNSHPVMVAPDTREFMALLQAMEAGGLKRILHLVRHPAQARIGLAARQQPSCHLDIPYWSTTPYLFGPGRAVKYLARPCSDRTSPKPSDPTDTYLSDALRAHLTQADACFDFLIQFQVDAERTPIEDATVEWQEQDSPFHRVGRIRIPRQSVDDPARNEACEASAFSPWHSLPAHRPLGSMNRARRDIYRALSELRQRRG